MDLRYLGMSTSIHWSLPRSEIGLVFSAMNTIVASRAGKDLVSSLASGLLTIGSRFGGALDEAAAMFSGARDTGLTPREFVDNSRKANKLSEPYSFFCIHRVARC